MCTYLYDNLGCSVEALSAHLSAVCARFGHREHAGMKDGVPAARIENILAGCVAPPTRIVILNPRNEIYKYYSTHIFRPVFTGSWAHTQTLELPLLRANVREHARFVWCASPHPASNTRRKARNIRVETSAWMCHARTSAQRVSCVWMWERECVYFI